MKEISCRDLGCCDHVVRGATDDELKKQLFEHARTQHPDAAKSMTPEMMKAMDAKIRQFTRSV